MFRGWAYDVSEIRVLHGGPLTELLDRRAIRVILTALAFAAVLYFIYAVRKTLILLLFALLFAYLLEPVVQRLQPRIGGRRGVAILIVYIAVFCVLAVVGVALGPRIASEGQRLGQSLPSLYEKISSGSIASQIGSRHGWSVATQQRVQQFLATHQNDIVTAVRNSGARMAALLTNSIWIILVPILAVFFLKDKRDFRQSIQKMVSEERMRTFVSNLLGDLDEMLARFVRAQLLLALISGAVYTAALAALRVDYALVLGAAGGMLEFIPLAGPALAAVAIVSVAFATGHHHLILVILFLGVWRILQDYVIQPRLLGGKVELHPLATIFAILAGGEIAGVIGIYLSVPAIAAARILWVRWRLYAAVGEAPPLTEPIEPVAHKA